ncbi:Myotubularin-related protein 12 [Halotydeus destructor]|nr:Myotubularin-related protein 12 [Halotydeus destructor]
MTQRVRDTISSLSSLAGYSPKSVRPTFVSYVDPAEAEGNPNQYNHVSNQQHTVGQVETEADELCENSEISNLSRSPSFDALEQMDGKGFRLSLFPANKNAYKFYNSNQGDSPVLLRRRSSSDSKMVLRESENVLYSPVDSVMRYNIDRKRTKGAPGRLVLTNMRLHFDNYHETDEEVSFRPILTSLPPFETHTFFDDGTTDYDADIDLINVHHFKVEPAEVSSHIVYTVYCNDFRCIEFQVLQSQLVKSLFEVFEKLTRPVTGPLPSSNYLSPNSWSQSVSSSNRIFQLPLLWYQLATDYPFANPADWTAQERHWLFQNEVVRICQINESLQLSANLPHSFITLEISRLNDVTLIKSLSSHLRGQRVPLVTFAVKKAKFLGQGFNVLMRSPTANAEVTETMHNAICPLRILDLNSMPNLAAIENAYGRLHEATYLYGSTSHYIKWTGKWQKIVLKTIVKAVEVSTVIDNECSALITEDTDHLWNPVVSSLVQIILDPHRRTIKGFESLLSKEFLFLSGFANLYPHSMKSPNHVIFTLFLDCVYQILSFKSNWTTFEFTSLYLIRLFDHHYLPSTFAESNGQLYGAISKSYEDLTKVGRGRFDEDDSNRRRSFMPKTNSFAVRTISPNHRRHASDVVRRVDPNPSALESAQFPMSISGLNCEQLMLLMNAFYRKRKHSTVECPQRLMQLTFFDALYLRWHRVQEKLHYYVKFPTNQYYYFDSVIRDIIRGHKSPSITETAL